MNPEALSPERVGNRIEPTLVQRHAVYAVHPSLTSPAYPFRVDYIYGESSRFTRDTRCTATNMATGQRSILRLGQLREVLA